MLVLPQLEKIQLLETLLQYQLMADAKLNVGTSWLQTIVSAETTS